MELKKYQNQVMLDLSNYLEYLNTTENLHSAWISYWNDKDVAVGFGGVPEYNNIIKGVPHVCMKVPTGGGKTFMACSALKTLFDAMPKEKPRFVVWLVPSDQILTQTINSLSNPSHPYRQKLDMNFSSKVGIYTKEMLLNGQNFSPNTVFEMLSICVLSYSSLRINSRNKEIRKVYQENGNLIPFSEFKNGKEILLEDTPESALIQVLRKLSPVTIVDESHNAGSDLSIEMLNNINPSFILDLTATPRQNSNIISYVDARELKKDNMVKLPVIVYNRTNRQNVIQDAIQLRCMLENQAIEEEKISGIYIRPIVLFQAQPNINEDSETFDKIKKILIDMGIQNNEIGIKTSKIDTISMVDIMSKECDIRYIITVNALKEGWDCSFTYILASLANKNSKIDVEQIVGRILRQPHTKKYNSTLLNTSYILTCSSDFRATLNTIVDGLNRAGFSRKDYRIGNSDLDESITVTEVQKEIYPEIGENLDLNSLVMETNDNFQDINTADIKGVLVKDNSSLAININEMVTQAEKQSSIYENAIKNDPISEFLGGELGDMLNHVNIQEHYRNEVKKIKIPQFFIKSTPDLFGDSLEILEKDTLSNNFSLSDQDAQVNFQLASGEIYNIDIHDEGDAVPKYKRASKDESTYLRDLLAKLPPEKKVNHCANAICSQINKSNRYASKEVNEYVNRIIKNMSEDELVAMETALPTYANKILNKIELLENIYRENQFFKLLDSGRIVCKESYSLPDTLISKDITYSIPKSLYEAEKDDMNEFEYEVIDIVVGLQNIKWWHRVVDRKDFRINGFINHYPDFMVMTNLGNLILIEAKGDYLDGDDSKSKLKLGRKWQSIAGSNYRYFMVFKDKELGQDGAYTLDKFIEVIKNL